MSKPQQSLINAVTGFLLRATEDPPEVSNREQATLFIHAEVDHGLMLSRAEAEALRGAVELVAKHHPRVGRKTIAKELEKACCIVHKLNRIRADVPVVAALETIERLNRARAKVFVEVSGLRLEGKEWKFADGVFVMATHRSVIGAAKSVRLQNS